MEPVVLRHRDATRQSAMYGVAAVLVLTIVVVALLGTGSWRWWSLVLLPVAAFAGYSSLRLATLRVRVDDDGLWEPDPFALTFNTPWSEIKRVRKLTRTGRLNVTFIGVEITYPDGEVRELLPLTMQAGSAYAEPTMESWIETIRAAKAAHS